MPEIMAGFWALSRLLVPCPAFCSLVQAALQDLLSAFPSPRLALLMEASCAPQGDSFQEQHLSAVMNGITSALPPAGFAVKTFGKKSFLGISSPRELRNSHWAITPTDSYLWGNADRGGICTQYTGL